MFTTELLSKKNKTDKTINFTCTTLLQIHFQYTVSCNVYLTIFYFILLMNCGAASSGRHGVFLPKIHVYLVLEAKNRMHKMEGSTYTVLLDLIIIILFEAEYHL
jgi:hypothetical protein